MEDDLTHDTGATPAGPDLEVVEAQVLRYVAQDLVVLFVEAVFGQHGHALLHPRHGAVALEPELRGFHAAALPGATREGVALAHQGRPTLRAAAPVQRGPEMRQELFQARTSLGHLALLVDFVATTFHGFLPEALLLLNLQLPRSGKNVRIIFDLFGTTFAINR